MVPDMHPIVAIMIIIFLLEHHAEEDAEESWCQNTMLRHVVGDGKRLREVTIVSDLILMQLEHHVYEIVGKVKHFQD